jgi:hypothetical protein
MDESTKLHRCAHCPSLCRPVLAILLIVLGIILLGGEILRMNDQIARLGTDL